MDAILHAVFYETRQKRSTQDENIGIELCVPRTPLLPPHITVFTNKTVYRLDVDEDTILRVSRYFDRGEQHQTETNLILLVLESTVLSEKPRS